MANGIELHDGQVVLKWNRPPYATAIYRDMHSMLGVHEHGGLTEVVYHQPLYGTAQKVVYQRDIDAITMEVKKSKSRRWYDNGNTKKRKR